MKMRGKAVAFLDGGPAHGRTIKTKEPVWAPLPVIHVKVEGIYFTYIRARQQRPDNGHTWRYVPLSDMRRPSFPGSISYDPYDD